MGDGWILEGISVPLYVHGREIILHAFPPMLPCFTTYSADFCWNIVIAFICSNSKGSQEYFQIKAVPVQRAHTTHRARNEETFLPFLNDPAAQGGAGLQHH